MNQHNWQKEAFSKLDLEHRPNGDKLLADLLDVEGIDLFAPKENDRSQLDQLCLKTFRMILNRHDPRWRLVYQMQRLKNEGVYHGPLMEHAIRADYLSAHASIRRGFARYIDEITIPQLARALSNIEIGQKLNKKFQNIFPQNSIFKCIYVAGEILSNPTTKVTGCQEALWQLQIFSKILNQEHYLGRIGFNFHLENQQTIVSITNIQGASRSLEMQNLFEELSGANFAEFLIKELQLRLKENFLFRGVANRPENQGLYHAVFKKLTIPTFKIKRFDNEPYLPSFEELFQVETEENEG